MKEKDTARRLSSAVVHVLLLDAAKLTSHIGRSKSTHVKTSVNLEK